MPLRKAFRHIGIFFFSVLFSILAAYSFFTNVKGIDLYAPIVIGSVLFLKVDLRFRLLPLLVGIIFCFYTKSITSYVLILCYSAILSRLSVAGYELLSGETRIYDDFGGVIMSFAAPFIFLNTLFGAANRAASIFGDNVAAKDLFSLTLYNSLGNPPPPELVTANEFVVILPIEAAIVFFAEIAILVLYISRKVG